MRTVAIFCSVVDNFGDIGICWRLARQLAHEHQWQVQLYVDDLVSFAKICPQVKVDAPRQRILDIQVSHWNAELVASWQVDSSPQQPQRDLPQQSQSQQSHSQNTQLPELATPDLVIEALACTVPEGYLRQVARQNPQALWLNLEYLSAEDWVEGCHGLPSPQSVVPLTKYFFFPGFTSATGGLLREQSIVRQAQNLQQDSEGQRNFWQQLGIDDAHEYQLRISLFAYGQANIASWLTKIAQQGPKTLMLVPSGVLAQQLCVIYPELNSQTGQKRLELGQLTLVLMSFIAQPDYDLLLACCDINFCAR